VLKIMKVNAMSIEKYAILRRKTRLMKNTCEHYIFVSKVVQQALFIHDDMRRMKIIHKFMYRL